MKGVKPISLGAALAVVLALGMAAPARAELVMSGTHVAKESVLVKQIRSLLGKWKAQVSQKKEVACHTSGALPLPVDPYAYDGMVINGAPLVVCDLMQKQGSFGPAAEGGGPSINDYLLKNGRPRPFEAPAIPALDATGTEGPGKNAPGQTNRDKTTRAKTNKTNSAD